MIHFTADTSARRLPAPQPKKYCNDLQPSFDSMAVYGFITSRTTGNADGTGALNIYPAHPDCAIFRHNTDRTELQAFIAPHAEKRNGNAAGMGNAR
jgi:hypothetical protein